jgi:C-terminal processing protease CtpA/Prc
MHRAKAARWFAALIVVGSLASAQAAESGNQIFDRAVDIVRQHFYAPNELGAFNDAVTAVINNHPELASASPQSPVTRAAVDTVLASLGASHTGRYVKGQLDYYELADVFRFALRRDIRRLFPPEGDVKYEGIGIATQRIDGKVFVSDVYDGGPAARAAVMPGDEIVAVDGIPFADVDSFRGKTGRTVQLSVRRTVAADPITIGVSIQSLQPGDTLLEAIRQSARVIDTEGHKIGVIRLWAYTRGDEVTRVLYDALGGELKDVDGLVLDLRSRWGGAPADAAETFVGGTADMRVVERSGRELLANVRWRKPMVAIIDEGTRSGMEILAYSLKKNGISLIGQQTAGDVLAATAFLLPDDSLLELAVNNVFVDDKRLEGNPVQPDIPVAFDVRYAAGRDPQLNAAVATLGRRLAGSN